MGFAKHYLPPSPGQPPPLSSGATRWVRFDEINLPGIVWHGRIAFGKRYGLSCHHFIRHPGKAPAVQLHFDCQGLCT